MGIVPPDLFPEEGSGTDVAVGLAVGAGWTPAAGTVVGVAKARMAVGSGVACSWGAAVAAAVCSWGTVVAAAPPHATTNIRVNSKGEVN